MQLEERGSPRLIGRTVLSTHIMVLSKRCHPAADPPIGYSWVLRRSPQCGGDCRIRRRLFDIRLPQPTRCLQDQERLRLLSAGGRVDQLHLFGALFPGGRFLPVSNWFFPRRGIPHRYETCHHLVS